MRKTTKIRKRIFALCLALTAFFAMPLMAGAAFRTTSGNMGGYEMYGTVNIEETHANAITGCQNIMAHMSVNLEYYCINVNNQEIEMFSSQGSSNTLIYRPSSHYRSYKATSIHQVSFRDYIWKSARISIDY